MATKKADDDRSLRRLGGGRWQTRDERFTVEPESGTWVLVDAEQTDELGLPLVRGPYKSLTDAKTAISEARTSGPAASPLAARLAQTKRDAPRSGKTTAAGRGGKAAEEKPKPPPEARWIADLSSAERARARRLIERLEAADISDAEGRVKADIVGDVPAIAGLALGRQLREIADEHRASARPDLERLIADLVDAVSSGRDRPLDVSWRLVDGDGRPINIREADLAVRTRERNSR